MGGRYWEQMGCLISSLKSFGKVVGVTVSFASVLVRALPYFPCFRILL